MVGDGAHSCHSNVVRGSAAFAAVDAVAHRLGRPVSLWGHSYGADCAMGAATLTRNIGSMVLYEPGLGMTYPTGAVETVEAALAAGDRVGAAVALLVRVVEMSDEEVEYIRSLPTWAGRLDLLATVSRELIAENGWVYRPGVFDQITARTMLLAGSDSPRPQTEATERAAAAISGSRIKVLEGHAHIGHRTHPAMVADIVKRFVLDGIG